MTRSIDADSLEWAMYHKSFETDDGRQKWHSGLWIRYKIFEEAIREAPTVDAVQVIRCKDCKFATITDGVYGRNPEVKYCDIWFPSEAEYMPITYYCASAEREEE